MTPHMNTVATLDPLLLVSVDDNAELVTVTVPAGYSPAKAVIRQLHELAGNLGYGIRFV